MTTRSLPAPRPKTPRPATVTLAQPSLSQWYAEWKARKPATAAAPARPSTVPG